LRVQPGRPAAQQDQVGVLRAALGFPHVQVARVAGVAAAQRDAPGFALGSALALVLDFLCGQLLAADQCIGDLAEGGQGGLLPTQRGLLGAGPRLVGARLVAAGVEA